MLLCVCASGDETDLSKVLGFCLIPMLFPNAVNDKGKPIGLANDDCLHSSNGDELLQSASNQLSLKRHRSETNLDLNPR